MLHKKRTSRILAFTLLAIWTSALSAQSLTVAGDNEGRIREAILKYSKNYDSTQSPLQIPSHTYYHLAFKEVLSDPALQSEFTSADMAVIADLPAHTDHSFIVKDQLELGAICADISRESLAASSIISIAGAFDLSRMRRDETLDDHYDAVTASLSARGQAAVHALIEEFRLSRNISYSTFDLGGFAAEFPDAAASILRNGCDAFYTQIEHYTPQTIKLVDQR